MEQDRSNTTLIEESEAVRVGWDRQRQALARELHDTIAHHVSAIAVQAQVGLALAKTSSHGPEVVAALNAIAEEATKGLAEMRNTVSALRADINPTRQPRHGISDLQDLCNRRPGGPQVHIRRTGQLDNLAPAIEAGIYRIAQESVTNALRHARNPSRIVVAVHGETTKVSLSVHDDGQIQAGENSPRGFGIIGMNERVDLLGGTISVGRLCSTGWTVKAELPLL